MAPNEEPLSYSMPEVDCDGAKVVGAELYESLQSTKIVKQIENQRFDAISNCGGH
jgi:hypothetical protein